MHVKSPNPQTLRHAVPNQRNAALAVLVMGSLLLAGYVVWSFATALLLAAALATTVYPAFTQLNERLFGGRANRRRWSAALCTALLFALLITPLAGMAAFLQREVSDGLTWVNETMGIGSVGDLSAAKVPPEVRQRLDAIQHTLHLPDDTLRNIAGKAVGFIKPVATGFAQASAALPIYAGLMLLAFFFFLADGHQTPALLGDLSPLRRDQTRELLRDVRDVTRAAVLGNCVTAVVQCSAVTGGLVVAGIPHGIFFGLLSLPASFIPVAGSALIWAPAAIGLAATGHTAPALGLTAWCMGVAALNTHVLKPTVVGNKVTMHPGLVFISILGGIQAFGMIGLLAGPMAMATMWTVVRIYRRSQDELREGNAA